MPLLSTLAIMELSATAKCAAGTECAGCKAAAVGAAESPMLPCGGCVVRELSESCQAHHPRLNAQWHAGALTRVIACCHIPLSWLLRL